MNKLAIHGGEKVKATPYNTPNRYGEDEVRELTEAIQNGSLMYHTGAKVREFEAAVQQKFGCRHCIMTTSGTAAIHAALAAVGVSEGDEVITTPMSDAGTFIGILAQHAVPIFADICSDSPLTDLQSAERLITQKTKAILVVHMAGMVADMDAFMEIGRKHGLAIVEDCSQCHRGRWKGQQVGTIGDVGAFSMNESKHMSAGDAGFITTNDPQIARYARLFTDKAYQRDLSVPRGEEPIDFLGMNYRPNCLVGAVGLAQLRKLDESVARRAEIARRYFEGLGDLPFISLPNVAAESEPAWWPIPIRYTGDEPSRNEIAAALKAEGIWADTGMSPANNILRTELIEKKHFYPLTDAVPEFWRDAVYDPESCPNVDVLQRTVIRLPMDHRHTDEDVRQTIEAYRKVWRYYFAKD